MGWECCAFDVWALYLSSDGIFCHLVDGKYLKLYISFLLPLKQCATIEEISNNEDNWLNIIMYI